MPRLNASKGNRHILRSAVATVIGALVLTTGTQAGAQASSQAGTTAPGALQSITRKDLQRHDLSIAGREVVQAVVGLAPGAVAPRHSHPGEEIIYVLKGTWVYQLDGQPPMTLKAGDVLFVPYGVVHSARNIGTETGSELATYVVEKGKPLLSLAK